MPYPVGPRELERLDALHNLKILDTPEEAHFDAVCRIARVHFGAPIVLVSLLAEDRQWFKARCGLASSGTAREVAFCNYTILSDDVFVVEDASQDVRFATNPLVTGEPGIRFYAGAPLALAPELRLGTLCVIDTVPRGFSPEQRQILRDLASIIVAHLRLHLAKIEGDEEIRTRRLTEAVIADQKARLAQKAGEISRQREMLQTTLDNMDQGLIMVDPDGTVLICNKRALQLLDLPAELMHAQPHLEAVKRWQIARGEFVRADEALRHKIEESGIRGDPLTYERERPNGTILEVRSVHLANGGVVRTFTDVTARKRAEETAAQGERKFKLLADTMPQIVWSARPDGHVDYFNEGWHRFTGAPPGSTHGHGWLEKVHPDDRELAWAAWRTALASGEPYEVEFRQHHHSGEYRWVLSRAVPLHDQAGQVERWFGTSTDIHETRMARVALAENQERYRALIEASSSLVWRTDAQGRTVELIVAKPFTGHSEAAHLDRGWMALIHPDDRAGAIQAWSEALRDGLAIDRIERKLADDGSYRWVQVRAIPLRDTSGAVREWIGMTTDIHDRYKAELRLKESEERLRLTVAASGLGIWDIDLETGRRSWSNEMREVLGVPAGQRAGKKALLKRIHPEDRARVKRQIYPAATPGAPLQVTTFRIHRADNGDERWVECSGMTRHDDKGRPVRMLGTIQDITYRKQADDALRSSQEHLRKLLQALPIAIYTTDPAGRITYFNEAAVELWGRRPELNNSEWCGAWKLFWPDGTPLPHADCPMAQALKTGRPIRGVEAIAERPDGSRIPFIPFPTPLHDASGRLTGAVNLLLDISDRKESEQKIWRAANQDPLTGLPNRAFFQGRLDHALLDAERNGTGAGLLLIDLDDFKDVNDTLGHDAGDALLKETARRISSMLREGDTVARLGGDEFAVILPAVDALENATRFAGTLLEKLWQPFAYKDRDLAIRASIGLTAFPMHHRQPDELMKDADIALYRAKAEGRNRISVYDPVMRAATEQRVMIARSMREAVMNDRIVPFYQPKVCFRTGRIVGFEALARWKHPSRGILTPAFFGSAFENPELAAAIGESLIRNVAADIRDWLDRGLDCGRIAVNLSSAEFRRLHLADDLLGTLETYGIPTRHFEVEVTETVFLGRSSDSAPAILKQLDQHGVSIALDDFGTGFASLTHLKFFPVHHIKIDRSFVRDLEHDLDDAAIVTAVIGLGRNLKMTVTAEGVETVGQAQRLETLGCDHAQGYLYAKPMVGSRVPWLLNNWTGAERPAIRRYVQDHRPAQVERDLA